MARGPGSPEQQPNETPQHLKARSPIDPATRIKELSEVLPLATEALNDTTPAGRLKILATLRRALRKERQNGTHGHWSYDLARHKALLNLYRREVAFTRRQKQSTMYPSLSGRPKIHKK